MAYRLFSPFAALIFASAAFGPAHAAELGEPRVSSYIGQQLVADVELTALEDASVPVQARLASADVYRGASIAMPPALAGLHLSVMRRDGRQYLHLTTLRPVEADHLHVYLELADGSQRTVRLATLWLSPDPNPVPPPAPVVVPQAALAQAPAPAPTPTPALAPKLASALQPKPAPEPELKPAPNPPPKRAPKPIQLLVKKLALAPAPALAPAACAAPAPRATDSVCAALDGKNVALRAEVGQLENKVKALQAAMSASAGVPTLRPAAKASPSRSTAKPLPLANRKARQKQPPKDEGWPTWIWIAAGGAVVVLGAGLFTWRRARSPKAKKKKVNKPEMEVVVTPRVMGDVKSRLMTEQAEPTLE